MKIMMKSFLYGTALTLSMALPFKSNGQKTEKSHQLAERHTHKPSLIIFSYDMAEGDSLEYETHWKHNNDRIRDGFIKNGFSVTVIGNGYSKPENYEKKLDSVLNVMEKYDGRYFIYHRGHGHVSPSGHHMTRVGTVLENNKKIPKYAETYSLIEPFLLRSKSHNIPLVDYLESCSSDEFTREVQERIDSGVLSVPDGTNILSMAKGHDVLFNVTNVDVAGSANEGDLSLGNPEFYYQAYNHNIFDDSNNPEKYISPSGATLWFKKDGKSYVRSARLLFKQKLGRNLEPQEKADLINEKKNRVTETGTLKEYMNNFIELQVDALNRDLLQNESYDRMSRQQQFRALKYFSLLKQSIDGTEASILLGAESQETLKLKSSPNSPKR